MNSNYKVGDLIYDANIYDGMNTHIDDLLYFTSDGCLKTSLPVYLNFVAVQADLLFR